MIVFVVLAQIASIIGWLLLVYSYYKDDIDKLLFVQIISAIFYCFSYLFLGAYSGFFVCFIELIKTIGYYKTDKDNLIFLFSLPIYGIMAIFSFENGYGLLPIIGSIIDGFSLTKNKNIATIGCIISNILWVIYDVIIIAYASALTDGLLVISNISLLLFGYSMLLKSYKVRIIQCRNITKNIYSAIYELDKKNYGLEYTWPMSYEKEIKNKNEENLYLLKYHNEIVGYLNCLNVSETEYLKILQANEVVKTYDVNNITKLYKGKKNYLIIDSINVKNKYHNQVTTDLISKKIKELIVNNLNESYKIESILANAVNQYEREVLEEIGFIIHKNYNNKEALYILDKNKIEEIYLKDPKCRKKYKVIDTNITEELLTNINQLDKKFFKDEYTWDSEYQIELYKKNPQSMILVTFDNKLVGYLNYLVINKDKYQQMIDSNISIDSFELDEINKFYKSKKNYITLNSVVISKKHQDGIAIKLLTKRLKKNLKALNSNKYKIGGINAIAISEDGQKFLTNLGFVLKKKLDDDNYLYILEKDELKKYLK